MFNSPLSPGLLTQNEQIQLVSLNLYPTRDYLDQYRRSYTMQLTGATQNALHQMIEQYGADKTFSNMGVSQMNNIQNGAGLDRGGIIRYSSTPTSQVFIPNGWASKRMRYELVVIILVNGVARYKETIVGFTDYYGASHMTGMAKLDPSMVFTIDSIVKEPIEQTMGVAGMVAMNQVGTADVIITNQNPIANPFTSAMNANQGLYTMRPQDVFTVADSLELINGAQNDDGLLTQNGLINLNQHTYIADTTLAHMAKPSNRRNDLLNSYTSRLLTNMYQSSAIQATPASDDFLSPQSQAMMKVKEQHMSGYSFAFCITRLAGSTCSTTGQFTYAELVRLDPSIDGRATVFEYGEDANSGIVIPPTDYTAKAYAVDNSSIIATMTSNTVLALMNTHGILQLACACDNYTGQPRCVVSGAVGPTENNRNTIISNFENSMVLELLGIVGASGIGSYYITVYAEAFNIVYVSVKLNGELQETPFVFPAFAAASNTPVVSNNFDALSSMAETVNGLVSQATKQSRSLITSPSIPMQHTPLNMGNNPMMPSVGMVNPMMGTMPSPIDTTFSNPGGTVNW